MSAARPLSQARSLLFVPGNRPERFQKALDSGADAVIIDLEDSVPAAEKAAARAAVAREWAGLQRRGRALLVRCNAEHSPEWSEDQRLLLHLQALPAGQGLDGLLLPKAEAAATLAALSERLPGVPLLPMIESAAGHEALRSLAHAPGVLRLVLGHIDFMADTGLRCGPEESELAPLRFAIAMATRLAKLDPAIDGATVQTHDEARLTEDSLRARSYGFGGKLCIHPRQVAVVHRALAPSAAELDWALRVLAANAASSGAAVQLDGQMVDLPVVLQAQRTLEQRDRV